MSEHVTLTVRQTELNNVKIMIICGVLADRRDNFCNV